MSSPALTTRPLGAQPVAVAGVDKSFGSTPVLRGASLEVQPGRMVALLGPSGCGKTTLLRIIAGLETADAGTVRVGDQVLTGPGVHVPPERRRIGMVFQDWALFPHLSVARNVAYGLPRGPRRERDQRVAAALEMVGLGGLGDRQPGTLSGGQQQRVALARAIAPEPQVLLLDEPFSNLDTALRVQVRTEVHHLLVELGITTVFVTHDQEEAFVLGDEVAVMYGGVIVQQATPADLYRAPATRWVAGFVGEANLVPGQARGSRAETSFGPVPLREAASGPVDVLVRPEELRVDPGEEGEAARSLARVELVEFYGHDTVYVLRLEGGLTLRCRQGSAPRFARGDQVVVRYDGPATIAYPAHADPSGP
ncbi:ABC transporter ATP-binding protein [Rhabdothermincola sediminis]|uniref:ABC transporter ATP-binding protein n=1 Tax=Rhabdothermincola sediminis TaxID=2751370 RepID=UPI001AA04376|nr:ABC transporter ATP-binding protein [Rhabdothermincola sediminis]